VRITDRVSRFSKIAGEMVPHLKIEDEIQSVISEHHAVAVTAVPDEVRGERLVVFYTDPDVTPARSGSGSAGPSSRDCGCPGAKTST
jgi:acyl-CoA synthetase (AMP-forming)/AMP-acid ligase II